MSTAEGWDLTVPEDAAELLAELRRHGVQPGERLHVAPAVGQDAAKDSEQATDERPRRRLRFTGMIEAEPDLSARTDDYLARGFGRE
jgi:hypothetical protein